MATTMIVLSLLIIVISILPFIPNQHWVFRVPEFMKLQLLCCQAVIFPLTFYFAKEHSWLWAVQFIQLLFIGHHIYILIRYTSIWRKPVRIQHSTSSESIYILSCNVYQFNTEYQRFVDLVQNEQPDMFLTMESNKDWLHALQVFEQDYPYRQYHTTEDTYGMHLFSKLKFKRIKTNFFVADDVPSMEAIVETEDGYQFLFFAVHPPPPSPTEEATAKERDGDLLSIAKRIRTQKLPAVVMGDFNTVAWAKTSKLFRKTSKLIDARIGRGILATFHAKYFFFRVPLDLCYHSPEIFIKELKVHPTVGSDHYPVKCEFHIDHYNDEQEERVVDLEKGEMEVVNDYIEEGVEEESENRNDPDYGKE